MGQSGVHDVSLPAHERRDAPLAAYRYHLRRLASMLRRVQFRNPDATIIWRQTTHARPMSSGCNLHGFPQTNPSLIEKLNDAAREAFRGSSVLLWEDPPILTASAPQAAFRDTMHHDLCGPGAET